MKYRVTATMAIPVSFVLEDIAAMPQQVGNAAHQYMQHALREFGVNARYEVEDVAPYDGDVIPTVVIEEDGEVSFA
jgi:hypothetical protein